jgi:uncharacterized protein (TIGR02118 family)
MVKLIAGFKRKRGVSVADFQHHWRTRHAELVVRQHGLRRYVQNHTLDSGYRTGEPDFDGVAEAWFDDTQAMRDLAGSTAYRDVRADEANFLDVATMKVVLTDEVVIVDGEPGADSVKLIVFLRRREDVSPEQFHRHWQEIHGPIAAEIPGLLRYVQCHARKGIYEAGRQPDYDGVPMNWFENTEAITSFSGGALGDRIREDEKRFMITGRHTFVIAREVEIDIPTPTKGPPG